MSKTINAIKCFTHIEEVLMTQPQGQQAEVGDYILASNTKGTGMVRYKVMAVNGNHIVARYEKRSLGEIAIDNKMNKEGHHQWKN